jgi:hypothetical protein
MLISSSLMLGVFNPLVDGLWDYLTHFRCFDRDCLMHFRFFDRDCLMHFRCFDRDCLMHFRCFDRDCLMHFRCFDRGLLRLLFLAKFLFNSLGNSGRFLPNLEGCGRPYVFSGVLLQLENNRIVFSWLNDNTEGLFLMFVLPL